MRVVVYGVLLVGVLGWAFSAGYEKGFDQGYDMAAAEVIIKHLDPLKHLQEKYPNIYPKVYPFKQEP